MATRAPAQCLCGRSPTTLSQRARVRRLAGHATPGAATPIVAGERTGPLTGQPDTAGEDLPTVPQKPDSRRTDQAWYSGAVRSDVSAVGSGDERTHGFGSRESVGCVQHLVAVGPDHHIHVEARNGTYPCSVSSPRAGPARTEDWAGWTRAQQHGLYGSCIGTPLPGPSRRSPWLGRKPNATHRLLPLSDRFGCEPTGWPPTSSLHYCRWPAIHSGVPPLPERPGGAPPGCSPSGHLRKLNRTPAARPWAWRAILVAAGVHSRKVRRAFRPLISGRTVSGYGGGYRCG